jgi:hypothetical protein
MESGLARYLMSFRSGGGVVVADIRTMSALRGFVASQQWLPLAAGPTTSTEEVLTIEQATCVPVDNTSAILKDITSFVDTLRPSTNIIAQPSAIATLVANFGSGEACIATTEPAAAAGRIVGLNFFPTSSDAGVLLGTPRCLDQAPRFWNGSTDGGQLLTNALVFAATPSNKSEVIEGAQFTDMLRPIGSVLT